VCHLTYGDVHDTGKKLVYAAEALDHLIPRRFLEHRGIDPHQEKNLLSVCGSCHGQKKTIEDRLFRGDAIGWLLGLRQIGYPVDQVVNFGVSVGLAEFKRLVGIAAGRIS